MAQPPSIRNRRLADQLLRDLAEIVSTRARDPRLAGINLLDARITRDLAWADIDYTVSETAVASHGLEAIEQALEQSAGFFRSELARAMKIRKMPKLRFHHDTSLERAMQLEQLLSRPDNDS